MRFAVAALPNIALRILEPAAAADFICIPGSIYTGGPIARAPEAVGRSVGPGAVGSVFDCHRRIRVWGYHDIVVWSAVGRCASAVLRRRGYGCQGRRSSVWGAGGGGFGAATSVAGGIGASTWLAPHPPS